MSRINAQSDAEWIPILQKAEIVSIRPIKGEVSGLAQKWLVRFEGGHEAMIKPVEPWSFLAPQWPTLVRSFLSLEIEQNCDIRSRATIPIGPKVIKFVDQIELCKGIMRLLGSILIVYWACTVSHLS